MVIIPKKAVANPATLTNILDQYKIRRLVLVPSLLHLLLAHADDVQRAGVGHSGRASALEALKLWVCSGETLTPEVSEGK